MMRHSQLSGIQRVSVMMIDRARDEIGASHVWFGYHDKITNSYKVFPCPPDSRSDLKDYATLCNLLRVNPSLSSLPGMKKYSKKPLKLCGNVWLRDLQAKRGNKRYFQRMGVSLDDWKIARAKRSNASQASREKLEFIGRPGDKLIFLDNSWHQISLEPWMRYASETLGLDIYVLLHDLIPLVTPQYVEGDVSNRFHDWLMRSTEYVTCYLANSENTGRDILGFLNSQNATQPVKVVPLAQDILTDVSPESTSSTAYPDFAEGLRVPDRIRILTKTPYVLVVGTMEVRKNLWQLATVWDRLRRTATSGRSLPKLVFAGRRGWLNGDFEFLMQSTGQLGGWVEIVEEPNDDVLAYLYQNCLFTVMASFYEGWGLPIGESLAYGKTAVVSETSSMPEVGGNMVEYCDPHSLDSIEAACLRLIDEPAHRIMLEDRISKAHLRSWDEVVRDMLAAVRN